MQMQNAFRCLGGCKVIKWAGPSVSVRLMPPGPSGVHCAERIHGGATYMPNKCSFAFYGLASIICVSHFLRNMSAVPKKIPREWQ